MLLLRLKARHFLLIVLIESFLGTNCIDNAEDLRIEFPVPMSKILLLDVVVFEQLHNVSILYPTNTSLSDSKMEVLSRSVVYFFYLGQL